MLLSLRPRPGALVRPRCATALMLLATLAFSETAAAHTSYLLPNVFTTPDAGLVTLQSAFTEDFSRPEVGIPTADWHVVTPSGARAAFRRIDPLEQLTVLEAELPEPGTYRFSTGERLGRVGLQVMIAGQWIPVEPGQKLPPGAPTRPSQTVTVADVYVSKGQPTMAAVEARGGRLELKPVVHPNAVTLAGGFRVVVLLDGKPVADQAIHLQREGGAYETPKFDRIVKTDARGQAVLSFDRPGAYLLMTRLSADAPPGSQTPIRSYTTSLTLEVTR